LQAAASEVTGGLANLATIPAGGRVVSLYDIRARNLGVYNLSGIDFAANYSHDTSFGSIDASLSGNYQLTLKNKPSPTAPVTDVLASDNPHLRFSAALGTTVGRFRAQATLNHVSSFAVVQSAIRLQDKVDAFDVVNLFLRYDVKGSGIAEDLQFTVNVNNVFNTDPPVLRDRTQNGFFSGVGLTIGRLIQFGISKKF
jgi:iron complex outermembrane receptor protein